MRVLIAIGVGGVSVLVAGFAARHSGLLFGLASLWLGFYGGLRLRDAIRKWGISGDAHIRNGLGATLTMAALLTFGNPHVYLDTVVLIGTVSLQFSGVEKISFGLGAASASLRFLLRACLWCAVACAIDGARKCLACSGRRHRINHVCSGGIDASRWRISIASKVQPTYPMPLCVLALVSGLVEIFLKDRDLNMVAGLAIFIIAEDDANELIFKHQFG